MKHYLNCRSLIGFLSVYEFLFFLFWDQANIDLSLIKVKFILINFNCVVNVFIEVPIKLLSDISKITEGSELVMEKCQPIRMRNSSLYMYCAWLILPFLLHNLWSQFQKPASVISQDVFKFLFALLHTFYPTYNS